MIEPLPETTLRRALYNLLIERYKVETTCDNRTKDENKKLDKEMTEIDDQIEDVMLQIDRAEGWGAGERYLKRYTKQVYDDQRKVR